MTKREDVPMSIHIPYRVDFIEEVVSMPGMRRLDLHHEGFLVPFVWRRICALGMTSWQAP